MMMVVIHAEDRGDTMYLLVHSEDRFDMMMMLVVTTKLLTTRNE